MRRLAGAIVASAALVASALAQAVDPPAGYRTENYDAPVPDHAPGALTVDDETAYALWRTGQVVVIDVMPDLKRPEGLPADTIWQGRVRRSIPGAIWMPEAGYGDLSDAAAAAFRAALADATDGDADTPVMFLCRADCWMSWNAAKRAAAWGYARVFWYANGSTGWEFWDWPTERLGRPNG